MEKVLTQLMLHPEGRKGEEDLPDFLALCDYTHAHAYFGHR